MSKETKKLVPADLFYTPKSTEELIEMVNRLSGGEKAIAMQFAMHGWNLACYLTNEPE